MNRELDSVLAKDLFELGRGFTSDDEISKYIEKLGLQRVDKKFRSVDYKFLDPATKFHYASYLSGDVRSLSPPQQSFYRSHTFYSNARISRTKLKTPRERLLLIMRRTMKAEGIYTMWKKGNRTAKEFIDSNFMKARSLGLV
jgi:hypothetical protein